MVTQPRRSPAKQDLTLFGCFTNVVLSDDSTVDTIFFLISEISKISPKVTKKENKNHGNKNENYYLFGDQTRSGNFFIIVSGH